MNSGSLRAVSNKLEKRRKARQKEKIKERVALAVWFIVFIAFVLICYVFMGPDPIDNYLANFMMPLASLGSGVRPNLFDRLINWLTPDEEKLGPRRIVTTNGHLYETAPRIWQFVGHWSSADLMDALPGMVWVFGDNVDRRGCGGQACIRYVPGAFGIPTKLGPGVLEHHYFSDTYYHTHRKYIDDAMDQLCDMWNQGRVIVLSENGYGNGLAQLDVVAPKLYSHLMLRLNLLVKTAYRSRA